MTPPQSTCVVAGCSKLGIDRLIHKDEHRSVTVRATLCDEHSHVCGAPEQYEVTR